MKKIGIFINNNCIITTWLNGHEWADEHGWHDLDGGWDFHQGIMWIQSRKDGPCYVGLNLYGTNVYSRSVYLRKVRSKNEH